jgi:hypothetical protein
VFFFSFSIEAYYYSQGFNFYSVKKEFMDDTHVMGYLEDGGALGQSR